MGKAVSKEKAGEGSGSNNIYRNEPDKASEQYELSLIGAHQLHNAALVLTGIEVLKDKGWRISDEAIQTGLREVVWPARLEVLSKDPVVILDGGHNPQCAEALTESLKMLLPEKKVVFLTGVLKDKDYEQITDLMMPFAKEFVCVTPLSDRALSATELSEFLVKKGNRAFSAESIEDGVFKALMRGFELKAPVVIFGSLYLAGAARKAFPRAFRKALRKQKIKARDGLTPEMRKAYSEKIVNRILASEPYKNAQTILIYDAIRGEASLEALKAPALADGKTLCYPKCVDKENMIALIPDGPDSFKEGAFGIREPLQERSTIADPADIDLVICPGTAFDNNCNRIGMGAGYYDRYLKKTDAAVICAAAFEVQFTDKIPVDTWDEPMDMIFTEERVVICKG